MSSRGPNLDMSCVNAHVETGNDTVEIGCLGTDGQEVGGVK